MRHRMAAVQQLSHAYPMGSRLDERGRLQIGGCDALELAREFGTPAFIVAEDDLRARARAFVQAFAAHTDDFDVLFASKAFPCTAVYRVLAEEGIGCDVASGGELATALRGGFAPGRILLHGNAKTEAELTYALDAGIGLVVVDGLDEVGKLQRILAPGRRQPVLIRVAPGVSPATHPAISTGGPNTKFGLNLDDARVAIDRLRADDRFDLQGIQFHIGSQILELDPFRAALEAVAGLGDFRTYDLGGGLGVAYTGADHPPSIEAYAAAKVRMVEEVCGPGRRVLDEPGRALVANSTVTLYTVESVKRNVDTWVAVDGGMSDNLRPMLYGARYEVDVADRFGGGTRCNVTGKHCESGDVLVRDADLADPRVGDVLVTPATGAYGYAMANQYNGALRPPVVFAKDGDARVVVRRDTVEDLFARDA
ncbi:MAG: diaminopimelate decarboxylase [Solirubrobacteraceae bacterium]|jgi:diaminopimelate decarboxylase|nr:diaminopimelate decarboxylase [Solirubrobacteraceae bacterium]